MYIEQTISRLYTRSHHRRAYYAKYIYLLSSRRATGRISKCAVMYVDIKKKKTCCTAVTRHNIQIYTHA